MQRNPSTHRSRYFGNRYVNRLVFATIVLVPILSSCSDGGVPEIADTSTQVDDAQANEVLYNCLQDAGLPVTRGTDGSVNFLDKDGLLVDDFNTASAECQRRLVDEGLVLGSTFESLQHEYQALSKLHVCLVDAGFSLVEWPTEQEYFDLDGAVNVLEGTVPIDQTEARQVCAEAYEEVDGL